MLIQRFIAICFIVAASTVHASSKRTLMELFKRKHSKKSSIKESVEDNADIAPSKTPLLQKVKARFFGKTRSDEKNIEASEDSDIDLEGLTYKNLAPALEYTESALDKQASDILSQTDEKQITQQSKPQVMSVNSAKTLELMSGFMTFVHWPATGLLIDRVSINLDHNVGILTTSSDDQKIPFVISGDFEVPARDFSFTFPSNTVLRQLDGALNTFELHMPGVKGSKSPKIVVFHATTLTMQCRRNDQGPKSKVKRMVKSVKSLASKAAKLMRRGRQGFYDLDKVRQASVRASFKNDLLMVTLLNFEKEEAKPVKSVALTCIPSLEIMPITNAVGFLESLPPFPIMASEESDALWEVLIGNIRLLIFKKIDSKRHLEETLIPGLLDAKREYQILRFGKFSDQVYGRSPSHIFLNRAMNAQTRKNAKTKSTVSNFFDLFSDSMERAVNIRDW